MANIIFLNLYLITVLTKKNGSGFLKELKSKKNCMLTTTVSTQLIQLGIIKPENLKLKKKLMIARFFEQFY